MRWVNDTLPPRPRGRWLLMTMRLSMSSLAGTARTLVAVGTSRLASMLVTTRAAGPLSGVTPSALGLRSAGCPADVFSAGVFSLGVLAAAAAWPGPGPPAGSVPAPARRPASGRPGRPSVGRRRAGWRLSWTRPAPGLPGPPGWRRRSPAPAPGGSSIRCRPGWRCRPACSPGRSPTTRGRRCSCRRGTAGRAPRRATRWARSPRARCRPAPTRTLTVTRRGSPSSCSSRLGTSRLVWRCRPA